MRRLSWGMASIVIGIVFMYVFVFSQVSAKRKVSKVSLVAQQRLVESLGVTDLIISTEARYTRHLSISDTVVISMDHPGALDHFPSSAFFTPGH